MKRLLIMLVATALVAVAAVPSVNLPVLAASRGPETLPSAVPEVVAGGTATRLGTRDASSPMTLAFGLRLRNTAALDAFLQEVATPGSDRFGQYLTQEGANAQFNPTQAQNQRVVDWLRSNGLTVTHTYPN